MTNDVTGSRHNERPDSDTRPARAATGYTATRIVHSSVHEITAHNPAGALYAPFRAAAFRDLSGVQVTYDQPSTVFASLGSAAINAIAQDLDLKIAAAAQYACTLLR